MLVQEAKSGWKDVKSETFAFEKLIFKNLFSTQLVIPDKANIQLF